VTDEWRERARKEIEGIKPYWNEQYGWDPHLEDGLDAIDLFVRFSEAQPSGATPRTYLLRLRYQSDFETAGRREAFVNPDKRTEEAPGFWPSSGGGVFRSNESQICLEGTFGFHSHLHRERDGRVANLNRLLMEIQKILNS
jgi:hypothetical protein